MIVKLSNILRRLLRKGDALAPLREEVEFLRAMGIHLFQGFLFARPAIERLIGDDEIAW